MRTNIVIDDKLMNDALKTGCKTKKEAVEEGLNHFETGGQLAMVDLQNHANYDMKVVFDPSTRLVKGKAKIKYFNKTKITYFKLL